jgi:L-iditol 2-dehydrogenase
MMVQALLFNSPHNIEILDYPIPKPGINELLLQVNACGICGTDFHIFEGKAPAASPIILGHEFTGEIVDKQTNLMDFEIGDSVAINPNIHCGYCKFCRAGRINLCTNLKALGVTLNGGFAQYAIVPASQAYKIPNELPKKNAAFAEPLSCCIHGINQASIQPGYSIAVIGAGTIGILMMQLARLSGAIKIYVIEPSEEKRKAAENFLPDFCFDPNEDKFLNNFDDISSGGVDVAIECAGDSAAAKTALQLTKKGGTIVLFGLASQGSILQLNLQSFFHKELQIKSSFLNPYTFQTAVDLLINNKIKVDNINVRSLPFDKEKLVSVFSGIRDQSVIKYMLIPNN